MPNSKQIVYLSQAQYAELIANGSITVDGVTVTYDENDIYVTPQAEPVTDVQVNGTSVVSGGVANVPLGSSTNYGLVKIGSGLFVDQNTGKLSLPYASPSDIKNPPNIILPIIAPYQNRSVFYGLAKAAGDSTQSASSNAVGTYTPEAKGAIQSMLGVSDLIAPEENNLIASQAYAIGDIFTANGKLYKVTSAIAANAAIIPEVNGEEVAGANCIETNVGEGFVKFTDYATNTTPGVVAKGAGNMGIAYNQNMQPYITGATLADIKPAANTYKPIVSSHQHESTFYGLAKAAGADEKDSTLPVGQYTDTAKTAIRSMIGATSSNIIAVQDTQPTDTDTKIWLPETAETPVQVPTVAEMNAALTEKVGDVQIDGVSIVSNGIANVPVASDNGFGVMMIGDAYGIGLSSATKRALISKATDAQIKAGNQNYRPIVSSNQHQSVFYGLAKAAGDTTQAASSNAVGTYTDDAKAAIKNMIGVNVEDVQVNGTTILSNGVANVPIASSSSEGALGVIRVGSGLIINSTTGSLAINGATDLQVKAGNDYFRTIVTARQHQATFYGLAKASGDTTQSASDNAVGTYTDNAKASIKSMLGIVDGSTGTVDISGTTPTIAAVENTRYVCGEVTSLDFTPAANGICIVRFTSGSSVTVLTLPSTVKFPEWFDPTSLETNTIYEICVTDGIYGAVMSWAL